MSTPGYYRFLHIVITNMAVNRFYFQENMLHFCHRNPWLMIVARRKRYYDQNLNSALQNIATNIRKLNRIILHSDSNLVSFERCPVFISIGTKNVLPGVFTVFLSLHINSKVCFTINHEQIHSSSLKFTERHHPLTSFDAE
jgi:hypothetical protein